MLQRSMKKTCVLLAAMVVGVAAACGSSTSDGNGGSGGSSGSDDVELVCTSGSEWNLGDYGAITMHPGRTCLACHAENNNSLPLTIAGTVYPTSHERDNCNGINGTSNDVTVVITDDNGTSYELAVNSVGNFISYANIALPYRAKVVANGKTNVMPGSQKNGDCNECHTERGANNAPGRILAPQ